jgi:hypothetical protein
VTAQTEDSNTPPETGDPAEKPDSKPETGERLPDDHPAAQALRKANKEAEALRSKLKEFEDRDKSEVDKLNERLSAAEARALDAERYEVALEKGLTRTQAKRLIGTTREELEADADELLADLGPEAKPANPLPTRPRPAGGDPAPTNGLKGKERAAAALRQFRNT